ncbi:lipoyl protein ligase domain-containing protein [Brevibacterium litoralis]|uniref:lipoyl protein ligase domain-containing protein n=1 Tax=Brevibacterium litoralis TaxID=3138935 RepID=UPI0032EB30FC
MRKSLDLVTAHTPGAVDALSFARVLLDSVRQGRRPGALRIHRPVPTAAFGARDRFLPGFGAAVEAARDHGFTPVIRSLGGRIALYHDGCLVIEHAEPSDELIGGTRTRFTQFGHMYTAALRAAGADAHLGEIPGEYCPGEHSVNVAGRIKAIGTAQRVTREGWLFSSSVVVEDDGSIRRALTDIQAALGVDWDPVTAGSIAEVHPAVTVDAVEARLTEAYDVAHDLRPDTATAAELAAMGEYDGRHRI